MIRQKETDRQINNKRDKEKEKDSHFSFTVKSRSPIIFFTIALITRGGETIVTKFILIYTPCHREQGRALIRIN